MTVSLKRTEGCRFIAVAGNIGAGKSTLVNFVEQRFGVKPFFEPNELNPYLKDFYRDMKRWAFHSQMYFLAIRLAHHQRLLEEPGVVIQDRTIYEDAEIFAKNLYRSRIMTKREYATYRAMYEAIMMQLPPPDLLIYLRCSTRIARRRIRERGRPEERGIPYRYVRRIHDLYEDWFASWDRSPTLVIDSDRLDYIHDLAYRADLLQIIANALGVDPNDQVFRS